MNRHRNKLMRPGMTLVELLVAVAILVLMVLGVGYVFTNSSRAVRLTQATIDANAAIRATMGRLREDLQSVSQDGFLLIADATDNGGAGGAATPPMIMFTATGRFASQMRPGIVANTALIVYVPVLDQQNGPNILARYVFLLTGNRTAFPTVSLTQLVGAVNPRVDELDSLARDDCLGISLGDLRALLAETPPVSFTMLFITPLQTRYARLNSAPQTIGYQAGYGGIENMWPYMVGGCDGMEVRYCDGLDETYVTVPAYPNEPAPWMSPDVGAARELRGFINPGTPRVGVTATLDGAPLEYIAWDYRDKGLWPDSLHITLWLRDAMGRLDSPRRFEGVFELP